jgi:short-subunit dehydrogenase
LNTQIQSVKRAVVTGHSKGLGQALTSELIRLGFDVLGLSRSQSEVVSGLQQVAIDLSDSAALQAWIESGALEMFLEDAKQAVVINNAGVVSPVNALGRQANVEIARAVELNITVPLMLRLCRLERLLRHQGGTGSSCKGGA